MGLPNNNRFNTCAVIASAAKQSSLSAAAQSNKLAHHDMEYRQNRDAAPLDCLAFGSQ
jgi:hypothetical protein